jgi:hypothetical protein
MRRVEAGLALALAVMAFLQSGCVLSGKPKTASAPPAPQMPVAQAQPTPPPEPLSVPQTQVQLPQPQPLPDAIALPAPRPEEPATPPAASRGRRTGSGAATQTKPETTTGPPATPPATAAPAEPERPPVQDILPPEELKRFQESAINRRTETRRLLAQVRSHRLNPDPHTVQRIQSFMSQSEDAEKRGDMRQADAFAERALVLAQEMSGAK